MGEVINLTHDAGDWSEYTSGSDGDRVYISANAGLNGTAYGIEVDTDASPGGEGEYNPLPLDDTETIYRLGLYFDKNTLSFSSGDVISHLIQLVTLGGPFLNINLANSGSGIYLEAELTADDGLTLHTVNTGVLGSGEFTYEVQVDKASTDSAEDGVLTCYVNGSQVDQVTGIDTFSRFEGVSWLEVDVNPSGGSISGIFYYDEIILRDDDTPTFSITTTHIWLSSDGGATFSNIGDSAWDTNVVGAVVVVPGTAYQTIFATVGTDLYKTTDGGTSWSLETAIGYEADSIDLKKDNTTVLLANRASGGNRASEWDGSVLTHINTSKSTTGGATVISNVV